MKNKLPQVDLGQNTFEVTINYSDLIIDKKDIALAIGYKNGEFPDHFDEMIDQVLSKFSEKCEINAGYRLLNLFYSHEKLDGLFIEDEYFRMNRIITSQLKKANMAAIFVCTIGSEMEAWGKQLLINGDTILSYLADIVASNAVENIANMLHDHIGLTMKESGVNITNRYSPGYCDWSVFEQQKLFSMLPPNFCKIKLTESSFMVPIKSISGVIGLGVDVKYSEYICDKCGLKDCTHRVYLFSKDKVGKQNR